MWLKFRVTKFKTYKINDFLPFVYDMKVDLWDTLVQVTFQKISVTFRSLFSDVTKKLTMFSHVIWKHLKSRTHFSFDKRLS